MRHLALTLTLVAAACSSNPPSGMCSRDTDCAPGQRCADGVCANTLQHEAGPVVDRASGELRPDGRVSWPDVLAKDGQLTCTANHDDKIQREEMPIKAGTGIQYTVGSGLTVNLQGTKVAGRTNWDLTANASDEHPYKAELEPIASWAAADFPNATYMALLDAGYKTYGIFTATQTALQMSAVISKTANDTKLAYSSPVDQLHFPIVPKDTFKTDAIVSGFMEAFPLVPIYNYETYEVTVLDAGTLKLPELSLDVVLVKVLIKDNPVANPFLVTTKTTFLFIAECYGIVGHLFVDDEPSSLTSVVTTERRRISK
jgi:hypothetical protein